MLHHIADGALLKVKPITLLIITGWMMISWSIGFTFSIAPSIPYWAAQHCTLATSECMKGICEASTCSSYHVSPGCWAVQTVRGLLAFSQFDGCGWYGSQDWGGVGVGACDCRIIWCAATGCAQGKLHKSHITQSFMPQPSASCCVHASDFHTFTNLTG